MKSPFTNRALSSNEMAAIYLAGSAGKCFTNTPAPAFVSQPAGQIAYLSNSTLFSVAAMGNPRPQYQWRFNGTNIIGATNVSLSINNVTASNTGPYTVVAS